MKYLNVRIPVSNNFASRIARYCLIGAIALGYPQTVRADDDLGSLSDLMPRSNERPKARSFNGTMNLFGSRLVHPMPVWSSFANGPAPAEQSKARRSQNGNLFRMDFIPRDEDFKDWKHQFSVSAFNQPSGSIRAQAQGVVEHFKSICSPSNLKIFPGNQTETKLVLVVACGNYSRQREAGEMAAVFILKNSDVSVTLMRQWRGTAFQTAIQSQWPVPKRELDGVLSELVRSRLIARK